MASQPEQSVLCWILHAFSLNLWLWVGWSCHADQNRWDWKDRYVVADAWRLASGVSIGVVLLEAVAFLEMLRMLLGSMPGDFAPNALLRIIRIIMMAVIFPQIGEEQPCRTVIYIWSALEACRYPDLVWANRFTEILRCLSAAFILPVEGAAEMWAASAAQSKLEGVERVVAVLSMALIFSSLLYSLPRNFSNLRNCFRASEQHEQTKTKAA
eukprot:TRINITY_DN91845_c0_g1_i1.p1 TRINITY_DN91845_c0_g1~~TRINITY_DN91845_c0_g1_i1.p1  ORF type:complete len:212 (+),score=43.45 TRINITY_DN91845_c0_g1_i1:73-708(+)